MGLCHVSHTTSKLCRVSLRLKEPPLDATETTVAAPSRRLPVGFERLRLEMMALLDMIWNGFGEGAPKALCHVSTCVANALKCRTQGRAQGHLGTHGLLQHWGVVAPERHHRGQRRNTPLPVSPLHKPGGLISQI